MSSRFFVLLLSSLILTISNQSFAHGGHKKVDLQVESNLIDRARDTEGDLASENLSVRNAAALRMLYAAMYMRDVNEAVEAGDIKYPQLVKYGKFSPDNNLEAEMEMREHRVQDYFDEVQGMIGLNL
jgi:hypothetical protein